MGAPESQEHALEPQSVTAAEERRETQELIDLEAGLAGMPSPGGKKVRFVDFAPKLKAAARASANFQLGGSHNQYVKLLKVLGIGFIDKGSERRRNGTIKSRMPRLEDVITAVERLHHAANAADLEHNKPEEATSVSRVVVGWSLLVVMCLLAIQPILFGSLSRGARSCNGLIANEHDECIEIENAAETSVPRAISALEEVEEDVSDVNLILQNCNIEIDKFEVREEQGVKVLEIIIPDVEAEEHNLANDQGEIKRELVESIVYKTGKGLYKKFKPADNVTFSKGPPMWWALAKLLMIILIIVGTIMGFALGYFIPAALCFLVAMFVL